MNLPDLLRIPLHQNPDKCALEFAAADGVRRWTYAELHRKAACFASWLLGQGLARGDRVMIMAANSDHFVVACLAVWQTGAILVPVNTRYRKSELAHIVGDCQPALILADSTCAGHLADIAGIKRNRIPVHGLEPDSVPHESADPPRLSGDDTCMLLYTSGTTGLCKGAMISHNNMVATVAGLLVAWAWRPDDVLLLTLPLFHVHGLQVGLTCALAAGATVLLRSSFDAEATIGELSQACASLFFGVPTMYYRLIQALEAMTPPQFPRMRLFCSGSGPLAAEDHRTFERLTGHVILERYGMTETGMNFSNPLAGPRIPGSVGLPLPGVSARVVDADDRSVPPGTEGWLLVRGSNVFKGYWNNPEATSAAFVPDAYGHLWFRTGDMAVLDPDSHYLTLLGRGHELIICGGINVYPREIEEVLIAHDGVREAAVVGRGDPEWGQVPVAFLVADRPVDTGSLLDHCRSHLASFKAPRACHFMDELPRNALGKLQKFALPKP